MTLSSNNARQEVMNLKNLSDIELTGQAGLGSERAKRELLSRILPRVRKTSAWLSNNEYDRDEIIQLALVQIIQSSGSFKGESSLLFWVDRITIYTAAKLFEKRDRRKKITERVWNPELDIANIEEQAALSIMKKQLSMQLETLPKKQHIPVILHYLYGYSVSEIASITDSKINTVRGRLRNGLKKIRKQILEDPLLCEWIKRREA